MKFIQEVDEIVGRALITARRDTGMPRVEYVRRAIVKQLVRDGFLPDGMVDIDNLPRPADSNDAIPVVEVKK